jgi:hypothetical protein
MKNRVGSSLGSGPRRGDQTNGGGRSRLLYVSVKRIGVKDRMVMVSQQEAGGC